MNKSNYTPHTPGPWFLDSNRRGAHIDVHSKKHGSLAVVVWQMENDYSAGKASPECEANAHLIAAAPDCLALNKEVLSYLTNDKRKPDDLHQLIDKILLVIQKAEGRLTGASL